MTKSYSLRLTVKDYDDDQVVRYSISELLDGEYGYIDIAHAVAHAVKAIGGNIVGWDAGEFIKSLTTELLEEE